MPFALDLAPPLPYPSRVVRETTGPMPNAERTANLIVGEVSSFLADVPPFQFLDADVLRALAGETLIEFHPRGAALLEQGAPADGFLRVVARGGAKVSMTTPDREELVIDYRSPGDAVGYLSLASGEPAPSTVTAVEDTVCYLIPRAPFRALCDAHPGVGEHFDRAFLAKYLDKATGELRRRSPLGSRGDRALHTTPVGSIVHRAPLCAPREVSIREAAALMSDNRVSSIVLTGPGGGVAGIITDRDLRDKVAAKGRDPRGPAAEILTGALFRADAADSCFDALLKMIRHDIHHLLVVEEGALRGVVTNHDLVMLQGTSPISVAREVESRQDLDGLAAAAGKVDGLIALLLGEGARAGGLARIVTEINDRVVRRALELEERRLGPAPLPWCWLALGSEGRREQTYRTDQDNALVYADPAGEEEARRARAWFGAFAAAARDALVRCGFPPCPAGYMAANPAWCRPIGEWKRLFSEWISRPTAEALLRALVFFDFRPVHGAAGLAGALRDHLHATIARQPAYLGHLANRIVQNRPPVGFFGVLVVEKGGEHRDELNLKLKAIAPLVDLARFFALEKGVRETATLDRVRALRGSHTIVGEHGDEIAAAFEFVALLRVHHQRDRVAAGRAPDGFVSPGRLSNLEKKTLRDAFALISRLQGLVIERYRASIW